MAMIDMKMPPKKANKMKGAMPEVESSTQDEYPYNLRISLNEDQLKKIEHVASLKVGDELELEAKGKIISMRSNNTQGGGTDRSVEIQITSLSCDEAFNNLKGDKAFMSKRRADKMAKA